MDNAAPMLRLYVKSRPYLVSGAILFLTAFNSSNALRVPMEHVPREIYDRYLSRVEADAPAEELRRAADEGNALAAYYFALRHTSYCPRDLRIKVDRALAFTYMRKAANLSTRPRAKAVLALYYLNEWGTPLVLTPQATLEVAEQLANEAKAEGQVLGGELLASGPDPDIQVDRHQAVEYLRLVHSASLPEGAGAGRAAEHGRRCRRNSERVQNQ